MYKAILSNWKLTFLWAVGICASTAFFFGRGGDAQLTKSVEQISGKQTVEAHPSERPQIGPDEVYDGSEWGSGSN
jgi:hypothetical protein